MQVHSHEMPQKMSLTCCSRLACCSPRGRYWVGICLGILLFGTSQCVLSIADDDSVATGRKVPDDQATGVPQNGLLLNYDFARGSAPDSQGRIKDLSSQAADGVLRPIVATPPSAERTGWLPHRILQRDGRSGWFARPAKIQTLRHSDSRMTMPFGMVRMDNNELAILCSAEGKPTRPIIAFSRDGGDRWSEFQAIPGATGRPMVFTDHGGGTLSFVTGRRYFSSDYGRTWTESVPHPPIRAGHPFHLEGTAWVDRDKAGRARSILELGWHYTPGKQHPRDDATVVFRRSNDGGRSWGDELSPPQWKFTVEHAGRSWLRGVSEGSIVRAANGDLVTALRSDMPPQFFEEPHDDSLEGTAISISKDNGKTWSKMNILFQAGRHHANLQRMPNGDIVCTLVVRDDMQGVKQASSRRGCDALVSRDHGRTWNLNLRYELDGFRYQREDGYWVDGKCGHIAAVALPDGQIISAYGHYLKAAAVLVKWRPDAKPAVSVERRVEDLPAPVEPSILHETARPNIDYRVEPRSLVMTGRAWIDVPLTDRLAALGKNGTIEMVVEPRQQGAMPVLVACTAPKISGFLIGYDQRNLTNSPQVLFSDQRVHSDRMEYSIQVSSQSRPQPFSSEVHQIAYVVRDGHGAFYRDGVRFSKQSETGDAASLFRYTVRKNGGRDQVRLSLGADIRSASAGNLFQGKLLAVRIYDRPLSVAELRGNLAGTR